MTPWIAARQALLSIEILQTRILGWVPISSSRGSSQPKDHTLGFCNGRQILYLRATSEAGPLVPYYYPPERQQHYRKKPISPESRLLISIAFLKEMEVIRKPKLMGMKWAYSVKRVLYVVA